jgi:hypothetical protein
MVALLARTIVQVTLGVGYIPIGHSHCLGHGEHANVQGSTYQALKKPTREHPLLSNGRCQAVVERKGNKSVPGASKMISGLCVQITVRRSQQAFLS